MATSLNFMPTVYIVFLILKLVSKTLVYNHSDFCTPPTATGVLLIPLRHFFTSSTIIIISLWQRDYAKGIVPVG